MDGPGFTRIRSATVIMSPKEGVMPIPDIADCINETCPWSGQPVRSDSLTEYDGQVVGFCNPGCRDKFENAIRHFERVKAAKGHASSR